MASVVTVGNSASFGELEGGGSGSGVSTSTSSAVAGRGGGGGGGGDGVVGSGAVRSTSVDAKTFARASARGSGSGNVLHTSSHGSSQRSGATPPHIDMSRLSASAGNSPTTSGSISAATSPRVAFERYFNATQFAQLLTAVRDADTDSITVGAVLDAIEACVDELPSSFFYGITEGLPAAEDVSVDYHRFMHICGDIAERDRVFTRSARVKRRNSRDGPMVDPAFSPRFVKLQSLSNSTASSVGSNMNSLLTDDPTSYTGTNTYNNTSTSSSSSRRASGSIPHATTGPVPSIDLVGALGRGAVGTPRSADSYMLNIPTFLVASQSAVEAERRSNSRSSYGGGEGDGVAAVDDNDDDTVTLPTLNELLRHEPEKNLALSALFVQHERPTELADGPVVRGSGDDGTVISRRIMYLLFSRYRDPYSGLMASGSLLQLFSDLCKQVRDVLPLNVNALVESVLREARFYDGTDTPVRMDELDELEADRGAVVNIELDSFMFAFSQFHMSLQLQLLKAASPILQQDVSVLSQLLTAPVLQHLRALYELRRPPVTAVQFAAICRAYVSAIRVEDAVRGVVLEQLAGVLPPARAETLDEITFLISCVDLVSLIDYCARHFGRTSNTMYTPKDHDGAYDFVVEITTHQPAHSGGESADESDGGGDGGDGGSGDEDALVVVRDGLARRRSRDHGDDRNSLPVMYSPRTTKALLKKSRSQKSLVKNAAAARAAASGGTGRMAADMARLSGSFTRPGESSGELSSEITPSTTVVRLDELMRADDDVGANAGDGDMLELVKKKVKKAKKAKSKAKGAKKRRVRRKASHDDDGGDGAAGDDTAGGGVVADADTEREDVAVAPAAAIEASVTATGERASTKHHKKHKQHHRKTRKDEKKAHSHGSLSAATTDTLGSDDSIQHQTSAGGTMYIYKRVKSNAGFVEGGSAAYDGGDDGMDLFVPPPPRTVMAAPRALARSESEVERLRAAKEERERQEREDAELTALLESQQQEEQQRQREAQQRAASLSALKRQEEELRLEEERLRARELHAAVASEVVVQAHARQAEVVQQQFEELQAVAALDEDVAHELERAEAARAADEAAGEAADEAFRWEQAQLILRERHDRAMEERAAAAPAAAAVRRQPARTSPKKRAKASAATATGRTAKQASPRRKKAKKRKASPRPAGLTRKQRAQLAAENQAQHLPYSPRVGDAPQWHMRRFGSVLDRVEPGIAFSAHGDPFLDREVMAALEVPAFRRRGAIFGPKGAKYERTKKKAKATKKMVAPVKKSKKVAAPTAKSGGKRQAAKGKARVPASSSLRKAAARKASTVAVVSENVPVHADGRTLWRGSVAGRTGMRRISTDGAVGNSRASLHANDSYGRRASLVSPAKSAKRRNGSAADAASSFGRASLLRDGTIRVVAPANATGTASDAGVAWRDDRLRNTSTMDRHQSRTREQQLYMREIAKLHADAGREYHQINSPAGRRARRLRDMADASLRTHAEAEQYSARLIAEATLPVAPNDTLAPDAFEPYSDVYDVSTAGAHAFAERRRR